VADLQALFMPEKMEHLYHVIIGNEGTGKTTAIRGALLSVPRFSKGGCVLQRGQRKVFRH
jgi:ABC-type Mn2+/Zn2+ transport system ATPase subunit